MGREVGGKLPASSSLRRQRRQIASPSAASDEVSESEQRESYVIPMPPPNVTGRPRGTSH